MVLRSLLCVLLISATAALCAADPEDGLHWRLLRALRMSRDVEGFRSIRATAHRARGTATVVAFSRRGDLLAFNGSRGGEDGILIWRVRDRLPVALVPEAGSIEQLIFSPDDRHLYVSGGGGGRGVLLRAEVATGDIDRVYEGHGAATYRMVLSPDGRTLVSSGLHEDRLIIHDTGSGEVLHEQPVRGRWISPSPDGRGILRLNSDRQWVLVPFRGTATEEVRLPAGIDPDDLARAVPTDEGDLFVVANEDVETPYGEQPGTLTLYRLKEGQPAKVREVGVARATMLLDTAISPNGKLLATAGVHNTVRFRSVPDLKLLARVRSPWSWQRGHTITQLRFSPDSKLLAVGRRMPLPGLIRTDTFEKLRPRDGHEDRITGLRFLADGARILTLGRDNTVCIRSRTTLKMEHQFALPDGFNPAVLSPEGDRLLCVAERRGGTGWRGGRPAKVLAAGTGKILHEFLLPAGFTDGGKVQWFPGRREFLIQGEDEFCRFDYVKGAIAHRRAMPRFWYGELTEDGRHLFRPVGNHKTQWDLEAERIDVATGDLVRIRPTGPIEIRAQGGGLVPGGRYFYLADPDFDLIERETCEWVATDEFPDAGIESLSFSGDGTRYAVVTWTAEYAREVRERFDPLAKAVVTVHDTLSGRILFARTALWWCRVHLAPDGRALFLVGSDGSLVRWTLPRDLR